MKSKKSILVIDDQESMRVLMANFLKEEYAVVTKEDGLKGLAWLQAGNIPQLILLDMSLPNLSGLEFLTNIRSSGFFGQIPVIIISGNESKDFQRKCFGLGITDYLTKPFNPLNLQDIIKKTLSQQQSLV